MDTTASMAMPGFAPSDRGQIEPVSSRTTTGRHFGKPGAVGKAATRWAAVAATIALLLTTALGGYLAGIVPSGKGPNATNIAAPFAGTPESGTPQGMEDPCGERFVGQPCGSNAWTGEGQIVFEMVPEDDLSVASIQLQSWELEGGEKVTLADTEGELRGVGFDVILNGAYTATFSSPVTVSRPIPGGGGVQFEYPETNTSVELSRGDAVTYQIGAKIELQNQFLGQLLQFQSILFYEGDPSASIRVAEGRFDARIEGDGTLATPLNEYSTREISILVTFLKGGYAIAPDTRITQRVLGPVATELYTGEAVGEGFIVWISVRQG